MSEQQRPVCPGVSETVSGESALNSLPLAMSYFPMSCWENLYSPETALEKGTLFACLDIPFTGKEGVENGTD